jgi:hypothetical protein
MGSIRTARVVGAAALVPGTDTVGIRVESGVVSDITLVFPTGIE